MPRSDCQRNFSGWLKRVDSGTFKVHSNMLFEQLIVYVYDGTNVHELTEIGGFFILIFFFRNSMVLFY